MRITRQTVKGTTYTGSFNSRPTPEQLEALDAVADAIKRRIESPESDKDENWKGGRKNANLE